MNQRIALGLPSLAGYSLAGALSKAKELGFQSVMTLPGGPRAEHSLGSFPTLGFYGMTEEEKRETARALAEFEHVAIHQAWDDEWTEWLHCAECVGAEIVTVHAGWPRRGCRFSEFIAERATLLRRMGEQAEVNGIRIGVENEGGSSDAYLELIASLDHPCLGATLDLGHCAYFEDVLSRSDVSERVWLLNRLIGSLVRRLGNKLYSVHVHDVRPGDWRDHRTVGSGVIDFPALFADLKGVGYSGLFEVELEEPAMEAAATMTGNYLTRLCECQV